MRKLVVLEHITIDGVIQAPGGPDEDPSGGFLHGGWISPYSDAELGTALKRQMNSPFDLLLGRKTFEIWASYWPHHADVWPGVNSATKYVASNTITSHAWQPSVFLNKDISEKVEDLKQQPGPDLHIWGSADLIQTLLKRDLIDVFWLMIYPLTLGVGKRLFEIGTIPLAFNVTGSQLTSKGVLIVNYERANANNSQ
jgi:dihydrofolate reductase